MNLAIDLSNILQAVTIAVLLGFGKFLIAQVRAMTALETAFKAHTEQDAKNFDELKADVRAAAGWR